MESVGGTDVPQRWLVQGHWSRPGAGRGPDPLLVLHLIAYYHLKEEIKSFQTI